MEAVGENVFAYTHTCVLKIKKRLYELEQELAPCHFIRCSKSFLICLLKVNSIRPALNGRYLAFDFLLIQAGITLSIGIIGCSSPSAGRPDYSILFLPFIYAFFCLLPSFVVYSSKELSLKQMVFRKILQFLLIEAVVLLVSYIAGAFINDSLCVTILLTVAIIYAAVNLIDYYMEKNDSAEMTKKIQQIKEQKKNESC